MLLGRHVFVYILLLGAIRETSTKERKRRYLVFTENTQYGVYATVSMPIESYSYVSVAWFYEAQYYNVANSTWFAPLLGDVIPETSRDRRHRSIEDQKEVVTRKSIYLFIETMLERHGYPGRACLLRAICENAEAHFLHNGLVGDLLYMILTPSTSISEDDVEDSFYEAEYFGLKKQCACYFEDCPANPLELITLYANNIS